MCVYKHITCSVNVLYSKSIYILVKTKNIVYNTYIVWSTKRWARLGHEPCIVRFVTDLDNCSKWFLSRVYISFGQLQLMVTINLMQSTSIHLLSVWLYLNLLRLVISSLFQWSIYINYSQSPYLQGGVDGYHINDNTGHETHEWFRPNSSKPCNHITIRLSNKKWCDYRRFIAGPTL